MDLRAALSYCPIAAILRGVKPDEIDAIGDALIEAGVTVIEVPLNSPQPFESIKRLAQRNGHHALVGAGTVLTASNSSSRRTSMRMSCVPPRQPVSRLFPA